MRWARLAYIGFNGDIEAFGDPNANRNFADYWLGCALRFCRCVPIESGVNVLYSSLSTVALGVASASQSLACLLQCISWTKLSVPGGPNSSRFLTMRK